MATAANFGWNTSLPFYPAGNVSGAVLLLSQNPCNNPYKRNLCCTPTHKGKTSGYTYDGEGYTCANWTGARRAPRAARRAAAPPGARAAAR